MNIYPLLALLVWQTPAKLEIKDITVGKGRAAQAGDVVTVDYRGRLLDGKEFDSSLGKPPFVFTLGAKQVIEGWDAGVVGMKTGGKRLLVIPPSMAYQDRNIADIIPPNSTLAFEMELLRIDRAGDVPKVEIDTLKRGAGDPARAGDTVELHYTGMFLNRAKFDSSLDRGEPFKVAIGQTKLIPGFTQGITGMKQGEKRRITIPAPLAYGDKQRGPIPANSTLVFEIEMLKITRGEK